MATKGQRIGGWVITALVSLVFFASGAGKLSGAAAVAKNMEALSVPLDRVTTIGTLEVAYVLLYAFPKTSFLGAILLTAYAGGAFFAHFRAGVPSPLVPAVLGVLVWVGYGLRHPEIIRGAFGLKES